MSSYRQKGGNANSKAVSVCHFQDTSPLPHVVQFHFHLFTYHRHCHHFDYYGSLAPSLPL